MSTPEGRQGQSSRIAKRQLPSTRSSVSSSSSSSLKRPLAKTDLVGEIEKDIGSTASKRPALSTAFSHHIAESSLSRQLGTAQGKIIELENKLTEKEKYIDKLENDRRRLADKEEELVKVAESERNAWENERKTLADQMTALRQKYTLLENEHGELQDSYNNLHQDAQADIADLQAVLSERTAQLNEQGEHTNELNQVAMEQKERIEELEKEVEQLREREERRGAGADGIDLNGDDGGVKSSDSPESWKVIRDELHRQASYMIKLEASNSHLTRENESLRRKAEGVEVLREQKTSLERQLEGADELRRRIGELEAVLEERRKREEEERREGNQTQSTPGKTPITITQQLAALQRTHALLLDTHGELKASYVLLQTEFNNLSNEKERLEDDLTELRAELQKAKDESAGRKREVVLLEREVGFLKALIVTYNLEESAQSNVDALADPNNSIADISSTTNVDNSVLLPSENSDTSMSIDQPLHPMHTAAQAQVRKLELKVQQSEVLLDEYKRTVKSLEEELEKKNNTSFSFAFEGDGMGVGTGRIQERFKAFETKIKEAEDEKVDLRNALDKSTIVIQKQSDKIENLEQTLFELGGEIGAGRHIPPNTRVLSLRQNPAQQWADSRKEVLDRLRSENEALLERLRVLTENGQRVQTEGTGDEGREREDHIPKESWETLSFETQELREQVNQKEKRLLRLQQVFTAKSSEFRDAVASILGIKLAFYPNGQVRATSLFDLNVQYVFQPESRTEGAKMQLIGQAEREGELENIPQLMKYWIGEEMCIPGFMASVTLECYDKMKREEREKAMMGASSENVLG